MSKEIDIAMTAVLRPEIIIKSLKTIKQNIIDKNHNYEFRLIVNIDPIGEIETCSQDDIEYIISKHHDNFITIKPEIPSFPLAVKNLWSLVEADFVLHTEDDRIYCRRVNFDDIFSFFDKNVGMIRIEAFLNERKYNFLIEEYKKHTFILNKNKKYPKKLISFHPTIYRREVVHQLKDFIKENSSPEWLLRLEDSTLSKKEAQKIAEVINSWDYLVFSKSLQKFSKDIGTRWRKDMGFIKDSEEGITNTWINKDEKKDNNISFKKIYIDRMLLFKWY